MQQYKLKPILGPHFNFAPGPQIRGDGPACHTQCCHQHEIPRPAGTLRLRNIELVDTMARGTRGSVIRCSDLKIEGERKGVKGTTVAGNHY